MCALFGGPYSHFSPERGDARDRRNIRGAWHTRNALPGGKTESACRGATAVLSTDYRTVPRVPWSASPTMAEALCRGVTIYIPVLPGDRPLPGRGEAPVAGHSQELRTDTAETYVESMRGK